MSPVMRALLAIVLPLTLAGFTDAADAGTPTIQPSGTYSSMPCEGKNHCHLITMPIQTLPDHQIVMAGVIVRCEQGEDGKIFRTLIEKSSGYRALDQALLSTVRSWKTCAPPFSNRLITN